MANLLILRPNPRSFEKESKAEARHPDLSRQKHDRPVAQAAKRLAEKCLSGAPDPLMPQSLRWSCKNWRELVARMKS